MIGKIIYKSNKTKKGKKTTTQQKNNPPFIQNTINDTRKAQCSTHKMYNLPYKRQLLNQKNWKFHQQTCIDLLKSCDNSECCQKSNLTLLLHNSFTPESARWLLKKGRRSGARKILSEVARLNGKEMPDAELLLPKQEKLGDFRDLFSTRKLAHKTLGSWLIW